LEVLGYGDVFVAAAIGVSSAAGSLCFMTGLDKGQRLVAHLNVDARVKPALGACLLAPLLWLQPQTMGLGVYVIQNSFKGERGVSIDGGFTIGEMLPMIFMKGVVTVVSLIVGFNGGVFAPSLFMGSLIGATIAIGAAKLSIVTAPVAVFAMTGMGSFAATVFGAPIFAVIIVLEMTASFPATTMVLVGVSTAYLLSHQLFAASLYEFQEFQHRLHSPEVGMPSPRVSYHQVMSPPEGMQETSMETRHANGEMGFGNNPLYGVTSPGSPDGANI